MHDYRDYHRTVVGYHGTTVELADRLVNGEAFEESKKPYEWLGEGVYFWEYAPKQAWWWTRDLRKNPEPAVVGAMIRLGNCLDLLDPANVWSLREVYDDIMSKWPVGVPVPQNVRDKRNLDCVILNSVYSQSDGTDTPIETSRGVFVPTDKAKRVWKGSWIYDEAHIQICVRPQENVLPLWHVRPDGSYGKD